jgi:hypothetical protein
LGESENTIKLIQKTLPQVEKLPSEVLWMQSLIIFYMASTQNGMMQKCNTVCSESYRTGWKIRQ